ncbi:MAG: sulfur carrier protein ThiS [Dehalococcoidia bacterium]|nr:sulfur carrier protein ThiS [Dehalococcoidia bacterium]
MEVTVNGERRGLEEGATLAALAPADARECEGIAMARNGEVVPRGQWRDTTLRAGDDVEIVRAVQGG